jgi:hypothetical protein
MTYCNTHLKRLQTIYRLKGLIPGTNKYKLSAIFENREIRKYFEARDLHADAISLVISLILSTLVPRLAL